MVKKLNGKLEGRALPVVMSIIFLDVLGIGILFPVLPQLVFKIFMPAGHSYSGSLIMLGWLFAIYPLMQFLATPILGQLSDRFGRKPILGFSVAGTALGYVLFAVAILEKNIPLLYISRAFDGITGGNLSVARAVIADASAPEHRTRNFGMIGAAFGLGFVMGPYIGARLSAPHVSFFGLFNTPHWFNTATPFWFTAILSALNVLLIILVLPETFKPVAKKVKIIWTKSIDNIRKAATSPTLRVIFGSEFLFWSGFTFFTTFFQILLIKKLNFSQSNVGDFFAYIGIWLAASQATLTVVLAKKFKNWQVLRFGFIFAGLTLYSMLWPKNTTQLLLITPFFSMFVGLVIANATALVSLSADKNIQGEVLGIDFSVQALAQSIPAIIAGYIATMGVNVPVLVGGSVVIVGGIFFNIFYKPPKHLVHSDTNPSTLG